jgi:hypothetical protein
MIMTFGFNAMNYKFSMQLHNTNLKMGKGVLNGRAAFIYFITWSKFIRTKKTTTVIIRVLFGVPPQPDKDRIIQE